MKQCKVLVLTHGDLAEAFVRTSKLILGDVEGICFLNMPEILDSEEYSSRIIEILKENCGSGLLIMTDLLGGSPFLHCSRIVKEYLDSIELVTGCNMPMLLEVGNAIKEKSVAELKDIAIEAGRCGIVDFKQKFEGVCDEN